MPQYRKKPVVIEAIQWNSQENIEAIEQMLGDKLVSEQREGIGAVGYWVKTLEGDMMISYNDYIIKGIKGEFYPCKPDIFEASYELVTGYPEMKHPDPYPQTDTVYTPSNNY